MPILARHQVESFSPHIGSALYESFIPSEIKDKKKINCGQDKETYLAKKISTKNKSPSVSQSDQGNLDHLTSKP